MGQPPRRRRDSRSRLVAGSAALVVVAAIAATVVVAATRSDRSPDVVTSGALPQSGFGRDDAKAGSRTSVTYAPGPQYAVELGAPGGPAPVISRVPTTDRVLFLGIDDGVTREPAALDYMERKGIPYTSFLVAGPLEIDPQFWAQSRAGGGTVQAHTLTHPNLTEISADRIRHELCGSADFIEQQTGVRPTLFRPPYGAYNETVRAIATECGYAALVMWTGTVNGDQIDLQEPALQPGDVLLLHWQADLRTSLAAVLARAKAEGFEIARLEDYLLALP